MRLKERKEKFGPSIAAGNAQVVAGTLDHVEHLGNSDGDSIICPCFHKSPTRLSPAHVHIERKTKRTTTAVELNQSVKHV